MNSLVGTVVGERYRVLRELGEGGMGRVYLAEHVVLGKRFALKVLRDEFCSREDLVKRFQQEAIAASRIGQENIVNVSDFGRTAQGSLYFVMEYLEGTNLAEQITQFGAMQASRAVPILIQITKALAAAHSQGIIHRDLKPDNVVLGRKEDGTDLAKVLDFGISKVGETKAGGRLTQQGMVVGTPEYMSPEQATGAEELDARSDIYSLGVMAYELLSGKIPFEGESSLAILLKHQNDVPVPLRSQRPDIAIPIELERLVMRMLEKAPESRPQSMVEVGQALAASIGRTFTGPTAVSPAIAAAPKSVAPEADPELHRSTGPMETLPAPAAARPRPVSPSTAPPPAAPLRRNSAPLQTDELAAVKSTPRETLKVLGVATLFGLAIGAVALLLWPSPRAVVAPVSITQVTIPQASRTPTAPPAPAPTLPVAAAPAPAPTPAPAAPPPSAVAPPPANARVQVSSTPSGAIVSNAHGKIGETPLTFELPAGGTERLQVSAAGYRPKTLSVSSSDRHVDVRLDRAAPAQPPKTGASPESDPYGKVDELKQDPYH